MIVTTTGARVMTDLISRRDRRRNVMSLARNNNLIFEGGDVTRTIHGPRHIFLTINSLDALFLLGPTTLTFYVLNSLNTFKPARFGISRESRK
jgi:hypothetical protein